MIEQNPQIHHSIDRAFGYRTIMDAGNKPIVTEDSSLVGPEVNMDIDFDELLDKKHSLEAEVGLISSPGEEVSSLPQEDLERLTQVLDGLSENEREKIYKKVWRRIIEETNYLHEVAESGYLDKITEDDLAESTWVVSGYLHWGQKDLKGKGQYDPDDKTIKIKDGRPSKKDILLSLVRDGILPHGLKVMIHEINSGLLYDNVLSEEKANASWYLKMFREFFTRRMGHKTSERTTIGGLISQQIEKQGDVLKSKPADAETLAAALHIDQLDALGLSPGDIMTVLKTCFSDKSTSPMDCVSNQILVRCRELGIDDKDLDNLVLANRLERDIVRMQVIKIVKEEIEKYI